MRDLVLCLAVAVLAAGQTIDTYTYNGTGERVRGPASDVSGDSRTEWSQSINGRRVPVEQVEQRIIRSDEQTKVIERLIRHFDPNGNPAGTERVVEERTMLADGGSTLKATTYRKDLSGNMQVAERSVTEAHKSATTQTADVVIERPAIDGSLQVAEKRVTAQEKSPAGDVQSTSVYRRDDSGRFYEAVKETMERRKSGGETVENAATYAIGTSGRLELASQSVKTSVKRSDGSESIVVDVYTQETPGRANASSSGGPRLKEQQVIERTTSGGVVTVVTSLRQASMDDVGKLGPARKVGETICRGKCDE